MRSKHLDAVLFLPIFKQRRGHLDQARRVAIPNRLDLTLVNGNFSPTHPAAG